MARSTLALGRVQVDRSSFRRGTGEGKGAKLGAHVEQGAQAVTPRGFCHQGTA